MTRAAVLKGLVPLRAEPATSLLPPPGFISMEGVEKVFEAKCPHHHRSRMSSAQKAGIRYQSKVLEYLHGRFGAARLIIQPWFYATDGRHRRYCQPDVILRSDVDRDCLTIIEIKIRWEPRAWWQLKKLYLPVVRCHYKPSTVRLVCLTRSYDPFVRAPEVPTLIDELESTAAGTGVGIFLWKP